jgi:outer membrane protein TolC
VRTEERYARMRARERVAEVYEKGVVPQDRMSVEAALASYRVGSVPFVAVLEALATLYDDRASYLETLAAHGQLRAGLEAASLSPDAALAAPATGGRLGAGGGLSRRGRMPVAGGSGMDGASAAAPPGASVGGGDAGTR